ncbi:ABC transporter permease [Sphaerobacter thermophilus]|uniref:Binding-protein-dependent transport systems inner membrane component n=1 Tax=Sphaerobacter thermophilus (strain ATCC 49802 / DSM 20745 / KCCM 41009 / NCIMB 13125 / S 6022) TaxID=479434 RepID=D1C509_SPHTD|nr:ABC transporter permease [Sphaerobacter thermophilus]ACZ39326.1 binding-protein-dependent transport systems inner membrane component [Sphaerobacter thermophilus DSM 20745]
MAQAEATLPSVRYVSQRRRIWRTFSQNRAALLGLAMVAIIVFVALAAPLLAPHDPLAQSVVNRLTPPGEGYPLGRDDYGRDILSRIIYGARAALLVGILSVAFGGLLGTAMGTIAGFRGGRVETTIMRVVDVMLAFPDLITGLLVAAVLGGGMTNLVLAIGLTIAPRFARVAHGPTLSLKNKDFVEAARALGARDGRLLLVHIVPNVAGELLVLASLWTASAIRLEASLSFIGLGVQPPTPSWGQMIRDGTLHLTDVPLFSLAPGIALLLTVLAFNLLGDGLRDALDPRAQA